MAKNRLTPEEKEARTQALKKELFTLAADSPMGSDERVRALTKIATNAWLGEYHEYVEKIKARKEADGKKSVKSV